MKTKWTMMSGIRGKILFSIVLAMMVPMALYTYTMFQAVQEIQLQTLAEEVTQKQTEISAYLASLEQKLTQDTAGLAKSNQLRQAMVQFRNEGNGVILRQRLNALIQGYDYHVLECDTPDFTPMAAIVNSGATASTGERSVPFIDSVNRKLMAAIRDRKVSTLIVECKNGNLALLGVQGVWGANGELVGILKVGYFLNTPKFPEMLRKKFDIDTAVVKGNRVLLWSLPGTQLPTLRPEKGVKVVTLENQRYAAMAIQFKPDFAPASDALVVLHDIKGSHITSEAIVQKLAVLFVFNLVLAILIAYIFSRFIIKPIKVVVDRVWDLTEGKLQIIEQKTADDELGALISSVNTMITTMQQLIEETNRVAEGMVLGNLSIRGNVSQFKGDYRMIVEGYNMALDMLDVISVIQSVLTSVSHGDLTNKVTGSYLGFYNDLQKSTNTMIEDLTEMVVMIQNSSRSLSDTSSELIRFSFSLLSLSHKQSQMVSSYSSALSELSASITEIAQSTSESRNVTDHSSQIAREGGILIQKVLKAMERIHDRIIHSSRKMELLLYSNKEIRNIIKVITDIAEQTDLLALNAAIEAARAGDQGRGFAVVADEIRLLAERSKKSADEIVELVEKVNVQSDEVMVSMREVEEQSESSSQLSTSAAQALEDIITNTNNVTDVITQISDAVSQQASVANDLTDGMEEVGEVSKSMYNSNDEMTRLAERLGEIAERLEGAVTRFKV